ncbi:MAG TPA: cytochrome d ubiquinol oxidase subunit II [Candidatus Polarisedimenticolia bacterium]|jgi:cytochrome d ubiquinol oxidase subunit II|nr:cytochrome d ubiquinol oxidase subunit II [Candidatus Polarisedimenticolia bacterium]
MIALWFALVSLSLTLYVVLDGFDLGAGVLHLIVARTDAERRQVFQAIGPWWDGNEVWLLATGTSLFLAFPKVLASALSGFYLAIWLVTWSLILRALGIEFRSHVRDAMWRQAWDAVFCIASVLLSIFLGAALGNLVRGVPLEEGGWFALTLFTDFRARMPVGILDWYTISAGVFALVALGAHGAAFLAWKTDGPVQERSRRLARQLGASLGFLWPAITLATFFVSRDFLRAIPGRPLALLAALMALAGLAILLTAPRRARDGAAFLGSSLFLFGFMVATAAGLFPVMLRSAGPPELSITAHAAAVAPQSLEKALVWWLPAFPLVLFWFSVVYRVDRGKTHLPAEERSH